ncbi:MAG: L,D-transpeptidase family protein [Alphaproteobacteria bacterium]|nr:L,D-transpeptidase family protein [Alphaproteobacteria bacterium]
MSIILRRLCGYYHRLFVRHGPNPKDMMRALTLLSLLGLMLSTLSTSASEELCPDAMSARGSLKEPSAVAAAVDLFYAQSGRGCVWTAEDADALLKTIDASADHGLAPSLFNAARLASEWKRSVGSPSAELDLQLTAAALKYALVMTSGLANALDEDRRGERRGLQKELVSELKSALDQDNISAWARTLPPQSAGYERLKYALGVYRDLDDAGGWQTMPASLSRKSARRLARDTRLARRLRIEGDLSDDDLSDDSNPIVDALKHFQRRHGIRATGKPDKATIAALNVSAHERVLQIAANLERWRNFNRIPASTRVEVNAAAAIATLYRDNDPVMVMNAVVGKPKHDTPILQSTITTVVINPPWIVPKSIIDNEIRPAIARDAKYLERNRMHWSDDGLLIQEPGPGNSLGRIKFEFPNNYGVYLHDTPAHALFKDIDRAQSHGCVRLERPLDLAEDLLRANGDWPRDAIKDAIDDGDTVRVPLAEEMPVTIAYWTAFVDDNGTIEFRPDIYDRDAPLAATLMPQSAEAADHRGA